MKKIKPMDVAKLYKGQFVTGNFRKKDGTIREFWGQLVYDERHPRVMTFYDKKLKAFRRINLDTGRLIVKSGDIEFINVA